LEEHVGLTERTREARETCQEQEKLLKPSAQDAPFWQLQLCKGKREREDDEMVRREKREAEENTLEMQLNFRIFVTKMGCCLSSDEVQKVVAVHVNEDKSESNTQLTEKLEAFVCFSTNSSLPSLSFSIRILFS
jgi:hypothetical protein